MRVILRGLLAAGLVLVGQVALAGPIETACMASSRAGGDRALCGCVQRVADITLTGADQRLVAKFFADPNKAESVRMQSSASANAFWDRYMVFGQQAEMACKG